MIVTKGMYDKEFKFDNNGKEESIIIKPLPAKYMSKLFSIINALNNKDMKELQILKEDSEDTKTSKQLKLSEMIMDKLLEEDILQSVVEVVTATVEKSYPNMEPELREEFITSNMFTILPFIFEVNFKRK